jgi:hypothetical protein
MEEYYKAGHEKLRQLVYLHHDTMNSLLKLLSKKQEKEAEFWNILLKHLKEVKQEDGKS